MRFYFMGDQAVGRRRRECTTVTPEKHKHNQSAKSTRESSKNCKSS